MLAGIISLICPCGETAPKPILAEFTQLVPHGGQGPGHLALSATLLSLLSQRQLWGGDGGGVTNPHVLTTVTWLFTDKVTTHPVLPRMVPVYTCGPVAHLFTLTVPFPELGGHA